MEIKLPDDDTVIERTKRKKINNEIYSYIKDNLSHQCFWRTRVSIYIGLILPPSVNLSLIMYRGFLTRRMSVMISITTLLCSVGFFYDSVRKNAIDFAKQDQILFQKMSLVMNLENYLTKEEMKTMTDKIKSDQ